MEREPRAAGREGVENGPGEWQRPATPPIEEDLMFNGTAVMRTTRVAFALIGAAG